jgi:hypothetical protein
MVLTIDLRSVDLDLDVVAQEEEEVEDDDEEREDRESLEVGPAIELSCWPES